MDFQNLSVARVIIHQVFKRQLDRQIVQPVYGASVAQLGRNEISALQERVLAALGSGSKCMEMQIIRFDLQSALHVARTLADDDEALFIRHSTEMANLLAGAQTSLNIPGGILVVFSGTANYPPKRIVGVIKAEPHEGFTFEETGTDLALKYLRNLILTPQTRLYKIGVFVEAVPEVSAEGSANGWEAYVYDDLMLEANRDRAAQYFYDRFLGCNIPVDGARQTRAFYELTRKFIAAIDVPEGDKIDLNTGLYTYLKVDQSPTLDRLTFANQYLPPTMRDAYINHMDQNHFPAIAVAKDLTNLQTQLKRRSFIFGSDVRLSAPAERFSELVTIETVEGEHTDDESASRWTRIIVRDVIRAEQ